MKKYNIKYNLKKYKAKQVVLRFVVIYKIKNKKFFSFNSPDYL